MGEHKKASGSSNDVMGHLQFVLLNRLDLSKRLVEKLEGKRSNYTSKYVNMYSKDCFFISLVNQLDDGKTEMDRDFGPLLTRVIGSAKKVFCFKDEINRQKMLFNRAVSHGCDSTWSRGSSNAFFELFTSAERFIGHLDELQHVMDETDKEMCVMLPRLMQMISEISSKISAQEQDEEIDDDDDNDDEESVEDEDEEIDDDSVDGNNNED